MYKNTFVISSAWYNNTFLQVEYTCLLYTSPYKDGYYSLYAGALACVGEEVPKMILIDPVNVTKANLEESWPIIYDEPLPDDIQSLLK